MFLNSSSCIKLLLNFWLTSSALSRVLTRLAFFFWKIDKVSLKMLKILIFLLSKLYVVNFFLNNLLIFEALILSKLIEHWLNVSICQ